MAAVSPLYQFSVLQRTSIKLWEVTDVRRNDALDALTYSYAAHGLAGLDIECREADLGNVVVPAKRKFVVRSAWLSN